MLVLRRQDGGIARSTRRSGETRWQAATGVAGSLPPPVLEGRVVVAGQGAGRARRRQRTHALVGATARVISAPPVALRRAACCWARTRHAALPRRGERARLWSYAAGSRPVRSARRGRGGRVLAGHRGSARRRPAHRQARRRALALQGGGRRDSAPGALRASGCSSPRYDAVLYALEAGNGHMAWRSPLPSRPCRARCGARRRAGRLPGERDRRLRRPDRQSVSAP